MNPMHVIIFGSFYNDLILFSYLRITLPSGLVPSGLSNEILQVFLFSTMYVTFPARPTFLDLIALTTE
jgi:hypothetical protein